MKRLRRAVFAAVAGLAFVPGCCCFDGQLLNRMGLGTRQNECCGECNGCCGSGQMVTEGPMLENPTGPFLDNPTGPYLPPAGGVIEPGPQPRVVPQAQPMPAPVSTIKIRN